MSLWGCPPTHHLLCSFTPSDKGGLHGEGGGGEETSISDVTILTVCKEHVNCGKILPSRTFNLHSVTLYSCQHYIHTVIH